MVSALDWLAPRPVDLEVPATDGGPTALLHPRAPAPAGSGPVAAAVRARTWGVRVPPDAVLCRGTALWVHTGRFPPGRVEAAHPEGRKLPGAAGRCRTAHLDPADVVLVGDVAVTTLLRTGADLARFWSLPRAADGLLALRDTGLDLRALAAALDGYGRRPHVHRARQVVAALLRCGPQEAALSGVPREPVMR